MIRYDFENSAQAMYTLWVVTKEHTNKNIRFDDFFNAVLINFSHDERQNLSLDQTINLFNKEK